MYTLIGRTNTPLNTNISLNIYTPTGRTNTPLNTNISLNIYTPTGRTNTPLNTNISLNIYTPTGRTNTPLNTNISLNIYTPTGRTNTPLNTQLCGKLPNVSKLRQLQLQYKHIPFFIKRRSNYQMLHTFHCIFVGNYRDHKCGFRRNRSTIDYIFCIRRILEKKGMQ